MLNSKKIKQKNLRGIRNVKNQIYNKKKMHKIISKVQNYVK